MPNGESQPLRHLDYSGRANQSDYKYPRKIRSSFERRDVDRANHANSLRGDLLNAESEADRLSKLPELARYQDEAGITIVVRSAPNYPLKLEALDSPSQGIVLASTKIEEVMMPDGSTGRVMLASVFIEHGKLSYLTKRLADYELEKKRTDKNGKVIAADHADLIANIESIGIAAIETLWNSNHGLPPVDDLTWWEVWIRVSKKSERERHTTIVKHECERLGIEVKDEVLDLPEHSVMLLRATRRTLANAIAILNFVSELRRPAVAGAFFIELRPAEQHQFADDLLQRMLPPPSDAPAVCVLDSGVNRGHPLLSKLLDENHVDAVKVEWGTDDHYPGGHGTPMAGLAAYGDLSKVLESSELVELTHRLESIKILPRAGANEPENYGVITQTGMTLAENNALDRKQRVFALAVTATDAPDFTEKGKPTAWSSALDSFASGATEEDAVKRLICVSGGNVPWNVFKNTSADYPSKNEVVPLEDPAQSWNALTIGACTSLIVPKDANDEMLPDLYPVAQKGGLSPFSATSCLWTDEASRQWPLKPDVVFEGGNLAKDIQGNLQEADSLSPLSTNADFQKHLFTPFNATSAATALAAGMAARLFAEYPSLWPESIRGMMVHSAEWTPEMLRGVKLSKKENVGHVVRRFGYGVPDLDRALRSAPSRATLFCQDSLQPFLKDEGIKTKDMMLYRFPWPVDLLREHGDCRVRMKVTLSYFIEPNPGSRAVSSKYRYAGCNLRFAVRTPTERSLENFISRVSAAVSAEDKAAYVKPDDTTDGWTLGEDLRCRGSIHSDTWNGTASQLASMEHLIVYPVNGWWKMRTQHKRFNQRVRYSLIVSIETIGAELDIYSPIQAEVAVAPDVSVSHDVAV